MKKTKFPITFFMLHKGSSDSGQEVPKTTLHAPTNHKKTRKRHKKGFSLIELLVTVGIIGVLSAVAIPAYNSYRQDAAKSAIISSLNSVAKGFAACLTLNSWGDCNTLGKMNVSCPGCQNTSSDAGNTSFCTNVSNQVGSNTFTGCMESDGGVPTVIGNWPIPCNGLNVTYGCISSAYVAPTSTCSDYGCTAIAVAPTGACTSAATHSCNTGNAGDLTNGTQPVGCSAGKCS